MANMNYNRPVFKKNLAKYVPETKISKLPVEHSGHELKRVKTEHHFGKLTCVTCGGKFVKWVSQDEYFKY